MRTKMMLLVALIHSTAWGSAENGNEAGFLIRSRLSYQNQAGSIEASRELIIPEAHPGWISLTTPSKGVVLLGKLVKADGETIHMEYMLVDTRNESSVVSTPAVIARLGEEAKISVEGGKSQVSVSLLAKRARFKSEPARSR